MGETGEGQRAAGWMHAQGDPPGTIRYWDGAVWQGEPQAVTPPPPPPGRGRKMAVRVLVDEDYEAAVAGFAEECVSEEKCDAAFLEQEFRDFEIVDFELSNQTVGLTNGDQTGVLVGTVTLAGGEIFRTQIDMLKSDEWKVCELEFIPGAGR